MNFETLMHLLLEPLFFVGDPSKRIFLGYLVSSLLLAMVVFILKQQDWKSAINRFVSLKLWLHPSSKQDFQWLIFNHLVRTLIVVPIIGGSLSLAIHFNRLMMNVFSQGNFWQLPEVTIMMIFTLVLFIVEDFSRFFLHYLYHKIPWLWRFHAIHHNAEVLTPITLYRIHWIEMCINSLRSVLVLGFISGLFMYCFDNRIGLYEIMGIGLFNFTANVLGANLRHSPIWLGFGKLEKWFISPAQHHIHHSSDQSHIDKNFGAILAIWDRMFHSWLSSKEQFVENFGITQKNIAPTFFNCFLGEPNISSKSKTQL